MFISPDTLGTTGVSIIEKENPHLISAINSSILETQKGTQHPTHYAHALAVTAHGHVLTYEWTPQSCQPLCHSIGALYFASQILYLLWSYMQQNCAFTIFIIKNLNWLSLLFFDNALNTTQNAKTRACMHTQRIKAKCINACVLSIHYALFIIWSFLPVIHASLHVFWMLF